MTKRVFTIPVEAPGLYRVVFEQRDERGNFHRTDDPAKTDRLFVEHVDTYNTMTVIDRVVVQKESK